MVRQMTNDRELAEVFVQSDDDPTGLESARENLFVSRIRRPVGDGLDLVAGCG